MLKNLRKELTREVLISTQEVGSPAERAPAIRATDRRSVCVLFEAETGCAGECKRIT